jgi:serine/threonine protein kinase
MSSSARGPAPSSSSSSASAAAAAAKSAAAAADAAAQQAALEKQKAKYKCVSHYIVGKTIGEGTFGKVKKGIHKLTGVKVCHVQCHFDLSSLDVCSNRNGTNQRCY